MRISQQLVTDINIHNEPQDDIRFWNQEHVLLYDTTRATIEQAKHNPLAGFDNSDTGNIETITKLKSICDEYGIKNKSKILEIGCGGGRICMIWDTMSKHYNMDMEITGIDHAPGAIEVCKARMPYLKFFTIAADEINKLDRQFDLIYTNTALQHNSWWKQDKIYDAIYQNLVTNGIFYLINEMTFDSLQNQIENLPPFYCDERGSSGTAAWWIGRIADYGFELMEYKKSSYIFKAIKGGNNE